MRKMWWSRIGKRITTLSVMMVLALTYSVSAMAATGIYIGSGNVYYANGDVDYDVKGYVYYNSNTASSLDLSSMVQWVYNYGVYEVNEAHFEAYDGEFINYMETWGYIEGVTAGEDVRIEAEMRRLYPGAERFFQKAHEPLIRKLCSQKQFEIRSLLTLFILTCAEERILRREWLKALSEKLNGLMQKHFGQKLTESIMQLALSVREAQSTTDVIAIRQKLMSLLEQEKAQAETQSQEEQCLQAKGQEQDETSQNLRELFAENNSAVSNPLDISQSIRKVPEKQPRLQLLVDVSGRIRPLGGRERLGTERLKRAKADSVALRLALQGLVLAKRRSAVAYQDWGRRLSFNRLARLAIGSQSVFEKHTENLAPNAAIHVLLDMSGSMGKEGGDLAIRSALGLLIGLEAIRGVNPAMTVFPGAACGWHQSPAAAPA